MKTLISLGLVAIFLYGFSEYSNLNSSKGLCKEKGLVSITKSTLNYRTGKYEIRTICKNK